MSVEFLFFGDCGSNSWRAQLHTFPDTINPNAERICLVVNVCMLDVYPRINAFISVTGQSQKKKFPFFLFRTAPNSNSRSSYFSQFVWTLNGVCANLFCFELGIIKNYSREKNKIKFKQPVITPEIRIFSATCNKYLFTAVKRSRKNLNK